MENSRRGIELKEKSWVFIKTLATTKIINMKTSFSLESMGERI